MKKIFKLLTLALAGAMFMVACDDTPAPYNPGGGEGGGEDTTKVEAQEITCAKAIELCAALSDGASSTETYAITGYITDVYATVSKGQQSFWMSDNNDGQKVVQAYWANLPEGVEAFTKGAKVKITGKLLKYVKDGNVTTEVKNATVEILEQGGGETPDQPEGEAKGTGTEADPFNVAGAIAYINKLGADVTSDVEVYVKGKVSANSTTDATIASYGNMTFDMIDEGNTAAVFKAFQVYGPGKQKFTAASQIAVGDEVVVCGKVVNYKGNTPETAGKGQSYVVSINGKTELPGGGETPDTPDTPGETTEFSNDLTCVMGANAYNDGKATVNGVENVLTVKIGTSKAAGSFTVTMPAGKHTFYAVAWTGVGTADVQFSKDEDVVKTVTVKENAGATGNAPYTLTVTDSDKYEIEVAEETTFTVTSGKRVIFFGIK